MTVAEAIAELQKMPPDATLLVDDDGRDGEARAIELVEHGVLIT